MKTKKKHLIKKTKKLYPSKQRYHEVEVTFLYLNNLIKDN